MRTLEEKTAIVVGSGIAGASICYALSKQNINTILLESESAPAKHASGNPIGVVYPFLTKHKTAESEFSLIAYTHFLEVWERLGLENSVPHANGIHFLLETESNVDRYWHALLSHQIPESIAKQSFEPNSQIKALYFPKGKALSPAILTKELIRLAHPTMKLQSTLVSWREKESDGKLICETNEEKFEVDFLFLAQGYQFTKDPFSNWIPMKQVRGQIVQIPSAFFQNQTSILYGDYLTAEIKGERVLGASFDEFHLEIEPRINETITMWETLQSKLPNLHNDWKTVDVSQFGTRVSYRTQSQDRHPVVGKLPNLSTLDTTVKYQNMFRKDHKPFQIPYYESVGILNGLGSRGLTHSLLAAEILVKSILNQTMDIPNNLINSLKPDRFLLRMWKRDQLT
ncbi:FAD-dependent 5-carboxymethylaminomethyl-2-thiouridine(34) oxidoreductase MnmC [Leptospira biflexa]|uniref:FAD-dependent 5-carboxymethylaminomethyl-2-thiouridine(34) oxidoreductase MnmC n=1 Tax=Leptospira biflexa TaxID=172 RepID=UPI00108303CE|nr:FAD-dependent 5-carboxymethylaminomethyl-2-thiouridine(34) oxidoreductase MnmC [Leptospira biflexa]TGM35245.1 FAD-dependent oxidoreductase [Leptospira biflexa]TGM38320.1 FAD-dependent oxidoreductase [Leptospira biflexa]